MYSPEPEDSGEDAIEAAVKAQQKFWKDMAKAEVRKKGVLRGAIDNQYGFCFKSFRLFQQAFEAKLPHQAWYHMMSMIYVTLSKNLHEPEKVGEDHKGLAQDLKENFNEALAMQDRVEEMFLEIESERLDKEENMVVRLSKASPEKSKADRKAEFFAKCDTTADFEIDDFKIFHVKGDGHCAFRALSQGMRDASLSNEEESEGVANLRTLISTLLTRHGLEKSTQVQLTLKEIILSGTDKFANFEDYIKAMKQRAYAGEIELMLLAEELSIRVLVLQRKKETYKRLASYGTVGKRIFLVWEPGKSESGNHYNLLLPSY